MSGTLDCIHMPLGALGECRRWVIVVITDITDDPFPEDFALNKKIHHCYLVKRYTSEEAMRRIGMSEDAIRERTRELREASARKPADTKRFRR